MLIPTIKDGLLSSVYVLLGRKPWSPGYINYRKRYIQKQLLSSELRAAFATGTELPDGYGVGMDERVVEYGWLFSRLPSSKEVMLDAGATLNHEWVLNRPEIASAQVIISTLAPEPYLCRSAGVSYLYGDLRESVLRDESMDVIACLSTLEHVGMDNTLLYTNESRFSEQCDEDYLKVVCELRRLTRPGGKTFITVPYGREQRHSWFQQFTQQMLENVISVYAPVSHNTVFYLYTVAGWQISSMEACQDAEYCDVHLANFRPRPDGVAAARAVACIELTKATEA